MDPEAHPPQIVPEGLRTDPPPEDGDQILAWAIDAHGNGYREPADHPRWVIAQFAGDYPGDDAYWRWSVPGRSTRVIILGWLPLPENDHWGEYAARKTQCDAAPETNHG